MNGATVLTKFTADTKQLKSELGDIKSKISSFAAGAGAAVAGMAATIAADAAIIARAFWDGANAVAQYGDEIDKTSQKVGFSAEAYQKWDYAMSIAGTSMQNCTVGLKTMTNKVDDALNGSKSAIDTFQRLGISVDDLKNKSREDIFGTVVSSLQQVEDGMTKAALANDLFGRSGQDLMPLFNDTVENTQKLMEETEKYGMVMSDDAVKASAAFQDSLTKLQKTGDGLKNKLLGAFLPGISDVLDGFSDLLIGEETAKDKIVAGVQEIAGKIQVSLPFH